MHQLNPLAQEFIPIGPSPNIPSISKKENINFKLKYDITQDHLLSSSEPEKSINHLDSNKKIKKQKVFEFETKYSSLIQKTKEAINELNTRFENSEKQYIKKNKKSLNKKVSKNSEFIHNYGESSSTPIIKLGKEKSHKIHTSLTRKAIQKSQNNQFCQQIVSSLTRKAIQKSQINQFCQQIVSSLTRKAIQKSEFCNSCISNSNNYSIPFNPSIPPNSFFSSEIFQEISNLKNLSTDNIQSQLLSSQTTPNGDYILNIGSIPLSESYITVPPISHFPPGFLYPSTPQIRYTIMDQLVSSILRELFRLQIRAHHKDPIKANMHRRYVNGLKEVKKYLKINEIKFVIICFDITITHHTSGPDYLINDLIMQCQKDSIPYFYSLTRNKLGLILTKNKRNIQQDGFFTNKVSIVGIKMIDEVKPYLDLAIQWRDIAHQHYDYLKQEGFLQKK